MAVYTVLATGQQMTEDTDITISVTFSSYRWLILIPGESATRLDAAVIASTGLIATAEKEVGAYIALARASAISLTVRPLQDGYLHQVIGIL